MATIFENDDIISDQVVPCEEVEEITLFLNLIFIILSPYEIIMTDLSLFELLKAKIIFHRR